MIDIENVKREIVERLRSMQPDKIILFGSYAYGHPNEESDIDLFLLKNGMDSSELRNYRTSLQKKLIALQKKYLIGIDLFVDNGERFEHRINDINDLFYREIMEKGTVIYAK